MRHHAQFTALHPALNPERHTLFRPPASHPKVMTIYLPNPDHPELGTGLIDRHQL